MQNNFFLLHRAINIALFKDDRKWIRPPSFICCKLINLSILLLADTRGSSRSEPQLTTVDLINGHYHTLLDGHERTRSITALTFNNGALAGHVRALAKKRSCRRSNRCIIFRREPTPNQRWLMERYEPLVNDNKTIRPSQDHGIDSTHTFPFKVTVTWV